MLGQGLIVRLLMDAGATAEDVHDYKGVNALELAIDHNEVDSIRAIVFHPNFSLDKKLGARIAIMATYLQDLSMLQELRQKGVKFEGLCPESHLPCLFIAYNLGFADILDFLLEVVTNFVLTLIAPSGDTLLTLATRKEDLPFIEKLLKNTKIDVNQPDAMKKTALIIAAESGQVEIVKLLLRYQADVDVQDGHYRTALMESAIAGHDDCVAVLLSARPATCLQDSRGRMAIELAKTEWSFSAILDYMYREPEKQTYEFNERVKRNLVSFVHNGRQFGRQSSATTYRKTQTDAQTDDSGRSPTRPKTAKARMTTSNVLKALEGGTRFSELATRAFE